MERHILHLHIPAFPVAVARVVMPGLRGRPVAVAPPGSDRGLVMAASAEARREGVWKGMPLQAALRRCPFLRVIAPDPELGRRASGRILEFAGRYSPLFEPARPGHIYLDVTGTERLWGRAKDAALSLGRDVAALSLPSSVGVSANKMVSSIASRLDVGDGIMDVAAGGEASFMAPLRTDVIPAIGDKRRRILLEELNIRCVGELAALDMGSLGMVFGRQAPLIRQRAMGIDPTPVYAASEKPLVSEEMVFGRDENDDDLLLGALAGLVERCAFRLRQLKSRPRKAGLLLRYSDRVESRRKLSLGCGDDLHGQLKGLFFSACSRRVRVRFMRVWFWGLVSDMVQLSLFDDKPSSDARRLAATKAVDSIRERYGEALIGYGNQRIHTSQRPLPLLQGLGDGRN